MEYCARTFIILDKERRTCKSVLLINFYIEDKIIFCANNFKFYAIFLRVILYVLSIARPD